MATKNTKNEQPIVETAVQTTAETNTAETKKPKIQLNRYQIISIVCASLLVALALGVGIYFIVKAAKEKDPGYTPPAVVLTADNYNQITNGMTYAEVFEILGSGKRSTNNEVGQLNYTWQDNSGHYIVITFTATAGTGENAGLVPGIVISKAQIGILD